MDRPERWLDCVAPASGAGIVSSDPRWRKNRTARRNSVRRSWISHAVGGLEDLGDDVVLAVGRAPLRAMVLGLGALVACGVLSFSTVESSTQASRVAARFDTLAATRLQIDLPIDVGTYRELGPAQIRSILAEDGIESLAWAYVDNAQVTSLREPHWGVNESVRSWTLGGDVSVLSVGRGEQEASLAGDGLWLGGAGEVAATPRFALLDLDGAAMPVSGVVRRSDVLPEMLDGVLHLTRSDSVDLTRTGKLVVKVRSGWAEVAARQLSGHIEPNAPSRVVVNYPPEAVTLRSDVVTRIDSLAVVVAASLLLVSAMTVGLATFARVLERRRLIGLLRAIGASRRGIVAGLVAEAAAIGVVAGTAGTLIGILVAVARSAREGGGLMVPWPLLLAALALALVVNGLGALLPAWAATRVPPIVAIRDL